MTWYWIALLAGLPSLGLGAVAGSWWERKHPIAQVQADIAAIKAAVVKKL